MTNAERLPDWARSTWQPSEYLAPQHYARLLKPYRFSGRDDVEMFGEFLSRANLRQAPRVLELGCGAGRATTIALEHRPRGQFHLVDLSPAMIAAAKAELRPNWPTADIQFHVSDSLRHLESADEGLDAVFSLWSLSHSLNELLLTHAQPEIASAIASERLTTLLTKQLRVGGALYIIHFDALSHEQTPLMHQWARRYPRIKLGHQSSSLILIEETLASLGKAGVITYDSRRLEGEPITYSSQDELLEAMMNLHLNGVFNPDAALAESVYFDLRDRTASWAQVDGSYTTRPGCFEISATRLR